MIKRYLIIFIGLIFLMPAIIWAQDPRSPAPLSMKAFATIPILHEGRIKPIESFAALILQDLSGHRHFENPARWLATTIFNPQKAATRPIIQILNPDLIKKLSLPARPHKHYSLQELSSFLSETQEQALLLSIKNSTELTKEQEALVRLHHQALTYSQLLQSMTAFLPLQLTIPDTLDIQADTKSGLPTWQDIKKKDQLLIKKLNMLTKSKGNNPEHYDQDDVNLAILGFEFQQLQQAGTRNILLRVIPPSWQGQSEWLSPWAVIETGQGSPQSAALLKAWQDMTQAWYNHDPQAWQDSVSRAINLVQQQHHDLSQDTRINAEILYNALSPFEFAIFLYLLTGLFAVLFLKTPRRIFYKSTMIIATCGLLIQGTGLGLRIFILQRPPVGSLYESLLFVSLIIIGVALIIDYKRRETTALLGGVIAGVFILFIAPVIAPEGDDLQMLVAVLNTNFWLATHVIMITAGYGLCIMTAMLAHFYLFQQGLNPERCHNTLTHLIYIISLIALLLTAVGTILGGIWADQSWGRFWGWDPKENGALLIVLWLIWAHHGKLSRHLPPLLFHTALATLNIIVALAWFGVNLLSVGLHSYGFISGIATGLALFCTLEIIIIGALWYRAHQTQTSITRGSSYET